ncbi:MULTISPECIES: relaxase/mobilization nuclease domain-containing protein [Christensenella]|uniref:RLX protein n=1 Tax=Christensenella hongkongensis TaxID=270498 RepID=A0A0M2NGC6_9FIRM|nr:MULTISPECIES: relaxase/mobilization nuclease domain-containing protein [Christensenella]KKI51589.1 RLX protein [Christensenella hongkongensis]TCW25513.1 relaxase/mobilization nuclease-like protein [Christensenella hongkongensis]
MAYCEIHPIKSTLRKALDYITKPEKTDCGRLVSSYGCTPETADVEFLYTISQGMNKGDNLAHHMIQSFAPGEVTPEEAHKLGQEWAEKVLKGKYEYVIATHTDSRCVNNHIMFCATNFADHHKYVSNKRTLAQIRRLSDDLCREHGLSVIKTEGRNPKSKSGKEYHAAREGRGWKAKLYKLIDDTIPRVKTFEEFLQEIKAAGYEISCTARVLKFRAPGQDKFTRGHDDYTEMRIRERIAGGASRKPQRDDKGVNLVIDIQNSIKAQQNEGYKRWAKVFNLKKTAKAVNYLSAHNITNREQLNQIVTDTTAKLEKTTADLKAVERRASDVLLTMKHLENYRRMKPIYDKYRATKNKDRFYAEHESSLILFNAAKKGLADLGVTGRVSAADLNREYEKLQNRKDSLYRSYRTQKKKVRELETIQANVNSLLEPHGPERHIEKER